MPARATDAGAAGAALPPTVRPRLWQHARLAHDPVRGRAVLLYPEGVLLLNESSAAILALCDGARTTGDIGAALAERAGAPVAEVTADVAAFVASLAARGVLRDGAASDARRTSDAEIPGHGAGTHGMRAPRARAVRADAARADAARALEAPPVARRTPAPVALAGAPAASALARPTTLLAELTHRCPLHCPYCSNPLELTRAAGELDTRTWCRVLDEARALGALQLGLSGGEPLVRRDLEQLVAHARGIGLYSTLVTSGLGLTPARGAALAAAGVDHVQLSLQGDEPARAERMAGARSWEAKCGAAEVIRALGVAFTVNVVLHRENAERVEALVALAAQLGAHRLELAHTQYYGWAAANRAALLPTRAQVARADAAVARARAAHGERMPIVYVAPDYHERYPKPCQGGWGRHYIVVAPDGRALPCHAASEITSLAFPSVRDRSLAWIWEESPAFNAFRGEAWMPAPCRGCDRRQLDFGGCRCQAFALTGDAARTDPVCTLSPDRPLIEAAVAAVERAGAEQAVEHAVEHPAADVSAHVGADVPYRYRRMPPARAIIAGSAHQSPSPEAP